jgi:hypothetical protein
MIKNPFAMKKTHLSLLLALLAGHFAAGQVSLSGLLHNYDGSHIAIGKASSYELLGEMDTLYLSEPGFEAELPIAEESVVYVDFFFQSGRTSWQRIAIFASPGQQIHFEIDFGRRSSDGERPFCQFSGANARGHELYYAFNYHPLNYHLDPFREAIRAAEDAASAHQAFTAELDGLLGPYQTLLHAGQIDSAYFSIVSERIAVSIASSVVAGLYDSRMPLTLHSGSSAEKHRLASLLLGDCPSFGAARLLAGSHFYALSSCLISKLLVERGLEDYAALPDTTVALGPHRYDINKVFAPVFTLPDEAQQETFLAHQLVRHYQILLGWTAPYDPAFAYFKARFPASPYLPAIERERALNAIKFAARTGSPPPAVLPARHYPGWSPALLDDFGQAEDLRVTSAAADLRQGSYYIDLWATWCRPCLEEMAHNYAADSLLDAHGIQRLYISFDKLGDRSKWLDTVYDLHLGGLHMLAGPKLQAYLSQALGQDPLLLPRYLFMKDGQIVHQSAARPSAIERLKEQVEGL